MARRYGEKILNKQPVALHGRLAYWLGNILVYAPLKNLFDAFHKADNTALSLKQSS